MNTGSSRPLVESALLAALGAVMMLLAWYVPVIGTLIALVSPLPAAVVVIRHGLRWGVLSSVVTLLVLGPLVGWIAALSLWVVNGAMGMSFGIAVRRNMAPGMILVTAAGGSLVAMLAEFASAYFMLGLTVDKQIDEIMSMWKEAIAADEKILGPNPALDQFAAQLPTKDMIIRMMPAVLVLGAFFLAYLNFEIFRRVLPRIGHPVEALPPFSRWIFPEIAGHLGILSFLAQQIPAIQNAPVVARGAENIFTVISILFGVEALSLLSFYLMRFGMPRVAAGLFTFMAVSMMLTSPGLELIAMLFGMIDVLFDFRHIRLGTADGS